MHRKLVLIVLLLVSTSILYTSCLEKKSKADKTVNADKKNDDGDDYDERIEHVVPYLNQMQKINTDDCKSIVILQTNKCNSCTKEKLDLIFSDVDKIRQTPLIFILHDYDKDVNDYLSQKLGDISFKILIDSDRQLSKRGLSFMKNVSINICQSRVINWKFYQ